MSNHNKNNVATATLAGLSVFGARVVSVGPYNSIVRITSMNGTPLKTSHLVRLKGLKEDYVNSHPELSADGFGSGAIVEFQMKTICEHEPSKDGFLGKDPIHRPSAFQLDTVDVVLGAKKMVLETREPEATGSTKAAAAKGEKKAAKEKADKEMQLS